MPFGKQALASVVLSLLMGARPGAAPPADALQLAHAPVQVAYLGQHVRLMAVITSDALVFRPTLYIRHHGASAYIPLSMTTAPTAPPGTFWADVPAIFVTQDFQYYLESFDRAGRGPARSGGPDAPWRVSVMGPPAPRWPDVAG